jgi:hypothetical protein
LTNTSHTPLRRNASSRLASTAEDVAGRKRNEDDIRHIQVVLAGCALDHPQLQHLADQKLEIREVLSSLGIFVDTRK